MIKKFLRRVFRLDVGSRPKIIPRKQHLIAADALSPGSRKVCEALQQAGYQAYVVGGAVRDLLLGTTPKDFDVATDALPDQVHALFRRSRLIGRRFKLIHVMVGAETVEVSTFRAGNSENSDARDSVVDAHGRVLRDNVYGNREQDAARRDLTINSLYYDPSNETVLDFHNGLRDLRRKSVRVIGDPRQRYREDPLRMLRVVRFAAKYGFSIDDRTREPIRELAPLMENVPPSRLFDEMLKLLLSGNALTSVHRLRIEGLHHGVMPMLDIILEQPLGERFVNLALEQTDERVHAGRPVSPAFLFAAMLWHEVLAAWHGAQKQGMRPVPALHQAMDSVLESQTEKLAIPRRLTAIMKEIWLVQPRFEQRSGKRPFTLLANERFRAGYDFLLLRTASGEITQELADWWQHFQRADPEARQAMLQAPQPGERHRRRRRRRPGTPPSEILPA